MGYCEKKTENILLAAAVLALDWETVRCQVRRTAEKRPHGGVWCEFHLAGVRAETWERLHAGSPGVCDPVWTAFCVQFLWRAVNRIQHEELEAIDIRGVALRQAFQRRERKGQ